MSIVALSDFKGEIVIAQATVSPVNENVQWFIDKYEPKYLRELLGSDFAALFIAGLVTIVNGPSPNILNKSVNALLAAGQPVTFFVDISLYPQFDPTSIVITKSPDGAGKLVEYFDMLIEDQDSNGDGTGTFTGWNITGHTTDGITLSEDLTIIISGGTGAGTYPTPNLNPNQRWTALLTPNGYSLKTAIANFIYYWYMRDQDSQTMGIGTGKSKAQNATMVSAGPKIARAWFEMVCISWQVLRYLKCNPTIYPEFVMPCWFNTFYLGWTTWEYSLDIFYTDIYYSFYNRVKIPDVFININSYGI